jgi:hypothetical protein
VVTWSLVVFDQGEAMADVIFGGMNFLRVTCMNLLRSVVSVVPFVGFFFATASWWSFLPMLNSFTECKVQFNLRS